MKKLSNIFFLSLAVKGMLVGGLALTMLSGCKDDPPDVKPPTVVNTHSGFIEANETWTASEEHIIANKVVVTDGATLTIEAGTIIKAKTGTGSLASALIIARGGKIIAEGTASSPIIFTSVLDDITPGEIVGSVLDENDREKWGGIIILGKAPISAENGDVEAQIEGIPAEDDFGTFGGNDPADNSGKIAYISIRHGGALIGEGNEINGLTLGGVGSGTSIHHVEVVANLDDGIECFGGTVNISNALVAFQGDDGIDLDFNYSGTIDNFIVIHGGDTDEGLEIDGPEGTTHTSGLFTLKNGTIKSTDGKGSAGDLKSKAQGTIDNCSFQGYTSFIKVRANFDEANSCAVKSDAWKYMTDASAKLIITNCEFVGASSLEAAVNAYTAVAACESALDAAAEAAMDAAVAAKSNSAPGSANKGANAEEFTAWTWAHAKGKI